MKKILIFAGTTEGRRLSECLVKTGIPHTICVATEYGGIVLKPHPLVKIHQGRMDRQEIGTYIREGGYAAVVDATHPYAAEITENIRTAMENTDIPYLRLKRETGMEPDYDQITFYKSHEACAEALKQVKGNILLTTGSKELGTYCDFEEVRNRLYVRVLPGMESILLCTEHGIVGKQILALQGPFTEEMNEAMIRQYQIKCLVTKKSGRTGGYQEKLEAACKAGIPVFVVGQYEEKEGCSFDEVCQKLGKICGQKIGQAIEYEITLAGIGMGNKENLTREVSQAIENADILLGAQRLIEEYRPRLEKKAYYTADRIIPYLKEMQREDAVSDTKKVVILFSGDSGFYSGCQALYQKIQNEIKEGTIRANVHILPGISSVAYLAACVGESYQDAAIYSMHGKTILNLADKIRQAEKTFLLVSGVRDMNQIGRLLLRAKLWNCTVVAGYRLSYPDQRIMTLNPEECLTLREEGLYVCLICNPDAKHKKLSCGRSDAEFIRGKIPMTKEEVREVSISKLRLHQGAVVYDIGSGTGSVSVEIAGLSDDIAVYAIEKKEEAVTLTEKNREQFQLENIEIIKGKAPECFAGLPVPTHAFIGGSGGNMKCILSALYERNPDMRVVINAVSMETICEIREVLEEYPVRNAETVQMQVSRAREAGSYHLMQAENPVWICAFDFGNGEVNRDET